MVRHGAAAWGFWGLMAALVLVPTLAGCVGRTPPETAPTPEPGPYFVAPSEAEAGRFYALAHGGGLLSFRPHAGASAQVELFDAQDRRVAEYGIGGGQAGPDIQVELPPGSYVLRMPTLNGTIAITSAGTELPLIPLEGHVERIVLAQDTKGVLPAVPFVPLEGAHLKLDLNLTRTPTGLRLLADGEFGWLELALSGPAGEVFRAESGPATSFAEFGDYLREVEGKFLASRARTERLQGTLDVEDLQGVLVLEAYSYSRAVPMGQDRQGQRSGRAPFEYGLLPSVPVAFDVASGASQLYLTALPDASLVGPKGFGGKDKVAAWVAVFGPDDVKLASVPVYLGTYTTVQVSQPGTYVAALLQGNATLGADVAPGKLGLRPLRVDIHELPQQAAGTSGNYGQESEDPGSEGSLQGVTFDVRPVTIDEPLTSPIPSFACSMQESLRIIQEGEVVAAYGPQWPNASLPTGALLGNGPLTLWHDGFGGSGCMRNGVAVHTYLR